MTKILLVVPWSHASYESKKRKIYPGKLYNNRKEILIKYWDSKSSLGLHTSDDYPSLKNYEISEGNIKCE